MRRRRFDATSGLDLFLDAICNTFGGIVFISMLVVVLINATSVVPTEDTKPPASQDPLRANKLVEQKAMLQEEIRLQKEAAEILRDSPELFELLATLKAERAVASRLKSQCNEMSLHLAQATREIDRLSSDRDQTARLLSTTKKELEAVEKQLASEIAARTKRLSLPVEKNTTLDEVPFFLKGGRLVQMNEKSIDRTANGIRPKPGAGMTVSKSDDPTRIETAFASYDPQAHYIAVVLWEDSFDRWPIVQGVLRRKKFSYRLLLLSKNESVKTGGSGGKVQ